MFLYMYAYTSNSINFDWYLHFHIYIYICFICAYYISIFLSTNFGYAKLDFLNDYCISIDYFSIGILIQAYASFLVLHKGRENSYFIFQLVFCIPLPCFMIEYNDFNWYLMP